MPRFICHHLPPSATLVLFVVLVLFVAEAATLLVATLLVAPSVNLQVRVADKSVSATLSATMQPTEYQSVTRIFKQRLQMADENENYFSCLSNVQLELIAKQAIFTSKIIRSLTNHKLYVHYTDIWLPLYNKPQFTTPYSGWSLIFFSLFKKHPISYNNYIKPALY